MKYGTKTNCNRIWLTYELEITSRVNTLISETLILYPLSICFNLNLYFYNKFCYAGN